jgi:hypothetical protein
MINDVLAGLHTFLTSVPSTVAMSDALTVSHLAAMALGLGAVLRTDFELLVRCRQRFCEEDLMRLERTHALIGLALVGLWATGLGLFALRTGGDLAAASPKLIAKLGTVGLLTLTALAMGRFDMALLRQSIGRALLAAPLGRKVALAALAGFSMGGWATALLLGGASVMLSAEPVALVGVVTFVHLAAIAVMLAATLMSAWQLRPRTDPIAENVGRPLVADLGIDLSDTRATSSAGSSAAICGPRTSPTRSISP